MFIAFINNHMVDQGLIQDFLLGGGLNSDLIVVIFCPSYTEENCYRRA